jgi:hypothetical protein
MDGPRQIVMTFCPYNTGRIQGTATILSVTFLIMTRLIILNKGDINFNDITYN